MPNSNDKSDLANKDLSSSLSSNLSTSLSSNLSTSLSSNLSSTLHSNPSAGLSSLDIALNDAEREGSCLMASQLLYRNSIRHNLNAGVLVEPYFGLYARRDFWLNLPHKKRITHIATRLAKKIKIHAWKFTGESAAALLNFETVGVKSHAGPIKIYVSCPYSDKHVEKSRNNSVRRFSKNQLCRVHLPDIIEDDSGICLEEYDYKNDDVSKSASAASASVSSASSSKKSNNNQPSKMPKTNFGHIPTLHEEALQHVASIYNVLFVCAWKLSFRRALPIFDSAARNGIDLKKVYRVCSEFYADFREQFDAADFQDVPYMKEKNSCLKYVNECDVLSRLCLLCKLADGKSENGGESLARAAMIELGFVRPQLQREFPNFNNSKWPYRVDFAWETGEKLIVAEFDGADKYLVNSGRGLEHTASSLGDYGSSDGDGSADYDESILLHYDRSSVLRERDRERHLLNCGVDKIVRFDFSHVVDPPTLEKCLLDAGVPKAVI